MEFTVTQQTTGETWSRASKKGAFDLADNIVTQRKSVAIVTLTETGNIEYTATPEQAEKSAV